MNAEPCFCDDTLWTMTGICPHCHNTGFKQFKLQKRHSVIENTLESKLEELKYKWMERAKGYEVDGSFLIHECAEELQAIIDSQASSGSQGSG